MLKIIKYKTVKYALIAFVVWGGLCFNLLNFAEVAAQEEKKQTEQELIEPKIKNLDLEVSKISQNLLTILDTISRFEDERSQIQASLESDVAKGREAELILKIEELSKQISTLEQDFVEISTGVKLNQVEDSVTVSQRDLTNELYILLRPIIKELQDLTSRPREIDQLKSDLAIAEKKLATIERGLAQIGRLTENAENQRIKKRLESLYKTWESDYKIQKTQRDVIDDKLKSIIASQKTFLQTFSDLSSIFFRSRGRNLIFALVVALVFAFSLNRIRLLFEKRWIKTRYNLRKRMIFVGIWTTSLVGSVLLFLLVLFFLGDWVLVVISFTILFGMLWGIKQFIPVFWAQIVLLLNMGTVREGERIKYRGVVWQVKRLHIQVLLENKLLSDKALRIPLKDLMELRSWSANDSEPWFPTKVGDWVLLEDGTYGQVQVQSVESIIIKLKGDTLKHYLLTDYLSQKPEVLSLGFRITTILGLDYSLLEIAAEEIPNKLKASAMTKLNSLGFDESNVMLSVEFSNLAQSSLEFAIITDFDGKYSSDYIKLKRLCQKIALEISVENHWQIPFPQLNIHLNKALD